MSNNLNVCFLIGKVTKMPTRKSNDNGHERVMFKVTTIEGEVETIHNIWAWGKVADVIDQHIKMNQLIHITGKNRISTYYEGSRQMRYGYIDCKQVKFLDHGKG
jgi:hypothetical protein